MTPTRTLYLDMDGVIVDFDAEFIKRFDLTLEQKDSLPSKEFWEIFNTNSENFFLNAPQIEGAFDAVIEVLSICKKYNINVEILTAVPKLSRYPTAKTEKRMWLKENELDMIPFNIGPYAVDKQNHCQVGDILIDDNVLNIVQWNARGGIGIYHVTWPATLKYLRKFLEHDEQAK